MPVANPQGLEVPTHYTPQNAQEIVAFKLAHELKDVRERMLPDLEVIERQVIAPTAELLTLVESIKKYMHKRANKLIDFDRHTETYRRLADKPERTSSGGCRRAPSAVPAPLPGLL